MNHRDRVRTALEHQAPDRCPMQVSFTPEFAARLRQDLRLAGRAGHNPHGGGNTYELERAIDEDMLLTSVGWANSYYQSDHDYTDEWGVGWHGAEYTTPFGQGTYTEISRHPLADEDAITRYCPPSPDRPELYAEAQRVLDQFGQEYWIAGVTVTTIFETAWALRGLDTLLMDFVINPDLAEAILDIPFRYHLAAAKRLTRMGVDMIWTGDDVGTQTGMMISPEMWRRMLKGRMARFVSECKAIRKDVRIAYHCDGNLEPIIPELIEIGIDILNPVQPACLDPAEMKRKYGRNLCFWGSIDEQHTLPFGTPADVAAEVKERLRTIGKGGGLILGPTHHVQLDTPLENFWAMVDTITGTPMAPHSVP